jgi:chromate reductase
MNKPLRILGIAGSLRRESHNRAALRAATKLVPEGVSIDIFELDGIPGFNEVRGAESSCPGYRAQEAGS